MRRFLVPSRALSFVRQRIVAVVTAWMFLIVAALGALAFFGWSTAAVAQNREDALFMCLSKKLGVRPSELRDLSDHARAFDPNTGRNFAYDGKAWIDTKTGEVICPKTPGELEDALFMCMSKILGVRPSELRDLSDHTRAFDPKTGRNFFYDKDKKAWRDGKTGECICPKCPPPSTASPKPAPPAPQVSPLKGKPPDAKSAESAPPRVASAPAPGTSTVPVIKDAKGQLPVRTARIGANSDFFTADLDVSPLWKIEAAKRTLTIILLESKTGCCVKARIVKGKFDPLIWTGGVESYPYQRVRSVTVTFDTGPPGQWGYSGGDYYASVPIPAGASRVTRIEMGVGFPADGLTQIEWELGR